MKIFCERMSQLPIFFKIFRWHTASFACGWNSFSSSWSSWCASWCAVCAASNIWTAMWLSLSRYASVNFSPYCCRQVLVRSKYDNVIFRWSEDGAGQNWSFRSFTGDWQRKQMKTRETEVRNTVGKNCRDCKRLATPKRWCNVVILVVDPLFEHQESLWWHVFHVSKRLHTHGSGVWTNCRHGEFYRRPHSCTHVQRGKCTHSLDGQMKLQLQILEPVRCTVDFANKDQIICRQRNIIFHIVHFIVVSYRDHMKCAFGQSRYIVGIEWQ